MIEPQSILSILAPASMALAAFAFAYAAIGTMLEPETERARRERAAALVASARECARRDARETERRRARIRRVARGMVDHGRAAQDATGNAFAGIQAAAADSIGETFADIQANVSYWAHVRIERADGEMVSHSFPIRAGDGREAREWANWALYEAGARGRSHVMMIRDGKRIVA